MNVTRPHLHRIDQNAIDQLDDGSLDLANNAAILLRLGHFDRIEYIADGLVEVLDVDHRTLFLFAEVRELIAFRHI